jgi:hypothetical protein
MPAIPAPAPADELTPPAAPPATASQNGNNDVFTGLIR